MELYVYIRSYTNSTVNSSSFVFPSPPTLPIQLQRWCFPRCSLSSKGKSHSPNHEWKRATKISLFRCRATRKFIDYGFIMISRSSSASRLTFIGAIFPLYLERCQTSRTIAFMWAFLWSLQCAKSTRFKFRKVDSFVVLRHINRRRSHLFRRLLREH